MSIAVKTASKDVLARLLATENLSVVHDPSAHTASMDVANRVLTLPVWENMTGDVYDMLVGHEVSHALYTPADGWREFVQRVAGDDREAQRIATMYVNVVEDARIERLIKARYPGLRRDFASAYRKLADQDIFGLSKVDDIDALPLIDRINLYFKIGFMEPIAFSDEERLIVREIEKANTFEEVCRIAEDLLNVNRPPQEQPEASDDADNDFDNGEDGAGEPGGDDAGETNDDGQDAEGQNGSAESGEGQDGDEADAGDGTEAADGEDSGESMTDDTDDGESAESTEAQSAQDNGAGTDHSPMPPMPSTFENEEKAKGAFADGSGESWNYAEIPTPNLDAIVRPYTQVLKDLDTFAAGQGDGAVRRFETANKAVINSIVQAFQRQQSAELDRRSFESRSGLLDPVRLSQYKLTDDIFLRHETKPEGKNHGLVFLLDWSGSMSSCLGDTIRQTLQLVLFCRKLNIPFEIYAFTSASFDSADFNREHNADVEYRKRWTAGEAGNAANFTLIQFMSSKMNNSEFKKGLAIMLGMGDMMENYYSVPANYRLGGTPLAEALIAVEKIIGRFTAENNVEKMNLLVLTDGEGHRLFRRDYSQPQGKNVWRDTDTRRDYVIRDYDGSEHKVFIQRIRDRHANCKVCGFFSVNSFSHARWQIIDDLSSKTTSELEKKFKRDQMIETPFTGYDRYFVIQSNAKVKNGVDINDLPDDVSFTKLRNTFAKGASAKKASRLLLSRFIDLIA